MQQQEISRLAVTVGPDFEGDGKLFIKFNVDFQKTKADEQYESLRQIINNQLDVDWALIFAIQSQPGLTEQLKQGLDQALPKKEGHFLKANTTIIGDSVYGSIRVQENGLIDSFNMFYDMGLAQISETQENQINFSFNSNIDLSDLTQALDQEERLLSAVLKQIKLELSLHLDKLLAERVREMVQEVDPDFANEPPVSIFQKFRNFDINLRFANTDKFPLLLKQKLLLGKNLQTNGPEDNAFKIQKYPFVNDIEAAATDSIKFWFTIPGFVAVSGQAKIPGWSIFLKSYGRGIMDLI